ncbi:MAG: toll/interleukin-1 receptor domain-containing protein, partial [Lachnospiraceae bacterium]|nr:toll/interleukin-1 receptor domain-containing protein [Lachnospiraceae bacterium]
MKYDAFISYRREGGFLMAQVIRERLKNKGINCFLDLEEDKAGYFDERLIEAINNSANFILILSKDALNRCGDENDWVRREIMVALNSNKHIIPVRYSDFVWPKELNEKFPDELKLLENRQGVLMSQEYLEATIDKIVNYMIDISRKSNVANGISLKSSQFIREEILKEGVHCVQMAFHAGAEWQRDSDKVDLLSLILEKKIKLQVLLNEPNSVEEICGNMRQPLKKYVSVEECVEEWTELAKSYPNIISVHVCKLPLLHRT